MGLLHELVPNAARIGLLVNPNMPLTESVTRDVTAAASAIGFAIDVVAARDSREMELPSRRLSAISGRAPGRP